MRIGLYLMLTISLGLHAGLAGIIALSYLPMWSLHGLTPNPEKTVELVLLRSEETHGLSRPVASSFEQPVAVQTQTPVAAPSPTGIPAKTETSPAVQPDSFALEANPNQHLRAPELEAVLNPTPAPHLNGADGIVFLLDVSGSMYEPYAGTTRLAIARQALARQIRALRDGTPFAITVYAETTRRSGPLVAASNETREAAVRFILQDYDCGGGTNLPSGLSSAQELQPGRLVLITDGDLNAKQRDLMLSAMEILGAPGHGPSLSILGVHPRPHSDDGAILRELAAQQGGAYHVEKVDGGSSLLTASDKSAAATP